MNDNRMKDALENIARRGVPENINLWPNISARTRKEISDEEIYVPARSWRY